MLVFPWYHYYQSITLIETNELFTPVIKIRPQHHSVDKSHRLKLIIQECIESAKRFSRNFGPSTSCGWPETVGWLRREAILTTFNFIAELHTLYYLCISQPSFRYRQVTARAWVNLINIAPRAAVKQDCSGMKSNIFDLPLVMLFA